MNKNNLPSSTISFFILFALFLNLAFAESTPLSPFPKDNENSFNLIDTQVNYWENAYSIKSFEPNLLDKEKCIQSEINFYGCIMVLKELANFVKRGELDIYPTSKAPEKKKKIIIPGDYFSVIESTNQSPKTQKEIVLKIQSERTNFINNFKSSYLLYKKSSSNDLLDLYQKLRALLPEPLSNKQLGILINSYYNIAINPHTYIVPTKELDFSTKVEGSSFIRLGISVSQEANGYRINKVIPYSSASISGLLSGDLIVRIDNKSVVNIDPDAFSAQLTGKENSQVKLSLLRKQQTIDKVIKRRKVIQKVVDTKLISIGSNTVTYIKLSSFMYKNTCSEIINIIDQSESMNITGYILDLRDNTGGIIAVASCILSFFVGDNKILSNLEFISEKQLVPEKTLFQQLTEKPLVVLINESSASSSEILAGAIQDYQRGLIVGTTSYGKGSHQTCTIDKKTPDISFCTTKGLFFLPSGRTNQTVGIKPDITAYLEKIPSEAELYPLSESNTYLFPLRPRIIPSLASTIKTNKKINIPYDCMKKQNIDKIYQQSTQKDFYFQDYQILKAFSAVTCL